MDRRLLERTVELARTTKAFDFKKLPKTLRVAVDSSPLEGAGRVEDTINLLGHAARKVAMCAADLLGWPLERVAQEAGIPVLLEASIKAALDLEWSAPDAKAKAINILVEQLDSLPGVGPATAQKILDYRTKHGAFSSVDELDAVPGIGPKRLDQLRDLVVP
jgi:competence ComEA-like helix-hairpin-helix protein